jgi:hypothetical protein
MAQTVITTDDIDGTAEAVSIEFSFDGVNYSIDLSKKNKSAFEKVLKPYIDAAKKTGGRRPRSAPAAARSRSRRPSAPKTDLAAVREWAAAQGIEVSSRGRLAKDVVDAYTAAH